MVIGTCSYSAFYTIQVVILVWFVFLIIWSNNTEAIGCCYYFVQICSYLCTLAPGSEKLGMMAAASPLVDVGLTVTGAWRRLCVDKPP